MRSFPVCKGGWAITWTGIWVSWARLAALNVDMSHLGPMGRVGLLKGTAVIGLCRGLDRFCWWVFPVFMLLALLVSTVRGRETAVLCCPWFLNCSYSICRVTCAPVTMYRMSMRTESPTKITCLRTKQTLVCKLHETNMKLTAAISMNPLLSALPDSTLWKLDLNWWNIGMAGLNGTPP